MMPSGPAPIKPPETKKPGHDPGSGLPWLDLSTSRFVGAERVAVDTVERLHSTLLVLVGLARCNALLDVRKAARMAAYAIACFTDRIDRAVFGAFGCSAKSHGAKHGRQGKKSSDDYIPHSSPPIGYGVIQISGWHIKPLLSKGDFMTSIKKLVQINPDMSSSMRGEFVQIN
jgi:hypothetical protein